MKKEIIKTIIELYNEYWYDTNTKREEITFIGFMNFIESHKK